MGDICKQCPVYTLLKDIHEEKLKIINQQTSAIKNLEKIGKLEIIYCPN